ncbi:MAG: GNAT family N-acetyltransferase [Planctomycetes bacterium]|nr:GNAT family N-acetyltransferase [Planctomycetota bacterium]
MFIDQSMDLDKETVILRVQEKDLNDLYHLIINLARFENLEDSFSCTQEDLRELLFTPHSRSRAYMAKMGDQPVGFILCYECMSTFIGKRGLYVEDLFVCPEYRNKGIATSLMKKLYEEASLEGYYGLEWQALDWNLNAHSFYRSLGAVERREWKVFRWPTSKSC